ncbi:MAG TPA: hypothetical protein VK934_09310 [Fimbriimonas sp.]|nr:hypothetical protein [Fimbriimonas sp.]
MAFKNFSIWRGKLPHWRADDVTYYVTFKHSRALSEAERGLLLRALTVPDGSKWNLQILCVLPERTELIFTVRETPAGQPYELSQIVEKAKSRVGKAILKKTGERFPPFYGESYDRIVRDELELEQRVKDILQSPVNENLIEDPAEYPFLYLPEP